MFKRFGQLIDILHYSIMRQSLNETREARIENTTQNNFPWAKISAVFTLGLVVVAGLGIWNDGEQVDKQIEAQQKQLDVEIKARQKQLDVEIKAQQKQLDVELEAQQNQLEVELEKMQVQLDQNQQILDTYYRPWVAVSVTRFVPDNTKNTFDLDYEVKNYGSVPAKNVRVYERWTIDETQFFLYSEERADFIKKTAEEPWVATMVAAGQSSNIHVINPWEYQPERFQNIINGKEILGIEFIILYDDISGDEQWSYLGIAYDFISTDAFAVLSSDGN